MSQTLDAAVKGIAHPAAKPPTPEPLPLAQALAEATKAGNKTSKYTPPGASASLLPSSPPQIYLNLLILEASLRAQYLALRSRKRLHAFFLLVLCLWDVSFAYALFLRPREDGGGYGGSIYWPFETAQKLALMCGLATLVLSWATGTLDRGIRWPRKWASTANRGLRDFNMKVVVVRRPFLRESLSHLAFLFPIGSLRAAEGADWHFVNHDVVHSAEGDVREKGPGSYTEHQLIEEDLAPGGDMVKLLLLPKKFSPDFRQNWEEYRVEYWEKENERRSGLMKLVKKERRRKAKEVGGGMWWSGLWRLRPHVRRAGDLERQRHTHAHLHNQHLANVIKDKEKLHHRRQSLKRSGSSHSGDSSRSTTPHELDAALEKHHAHERRGSGTRKRTEKKSGTASNRNSQLMALTRMDSDEGRNPVQAGALGSESGSNVG